MQKRLGKACNGLQVRPDESFFEAEADDIAGQVISGKPISGITPDNTVTARCWSWAGHYWTVYLASLAAGLSKASSFVNAFYAQMPDQVDELDATEAGKSVVPHTLALAIPGDYGVNKLLVDRSVQLGLHALTGRDSAGETHFRMQILKAFKPDTFEFSLALHPFGDSYAHRKIDDPTKMYTFPFGHLVEMARLDGHSIRNPHAPDFVNTRAALYREYGLAMFDLFVDKWKTVPKIDRDKFSDHLDKISSLMGDLDQIGEIKVITIREAGVAALAYSPEFEPLADWKKFRSGHTWLAPNLLQRALSCAADWAR